jgi:arsenite methyltransferase
VTRPEPASDTDNIHAQVTARFAALAADPTSEKRFEIGRASALKLGYAASLLDSLPAAAVNSFAGVGNPLALAPIQPGMTVLDLGCGSGVDAMIAAQLVGPGGRVIGIDMTAEMVARARRACAARGLSNVQIVQAMAERLDVPDASIDAVLSNGVVNLCPHKEQVLAELHRILKPGGRLQLADMSLVEGVNSELLARVGQWSD